MSESIQIYHRRKNAEEIEQVFGEAPMRALYENPVGRFLADRFLSGRWFSDLYGKYQSTARSASAIPEFVQKFGIPMQDYEEKSYASFNEFFIRRFRPGKRVFDPNPKHLPAFAEGRYLAFESVTENTPLPIKGATLNVCALLGNRADIAPFVGGPGYIARLCPVDYHRFHFPDAGKVLVRERLRGPLHSVNPIALAQRGDILFTNERVLSILETENFGKLAYLEVGALGVGKIVETHPTCLDFKRGDEKGYFLFGGSTVILIGERGSFKIDSDLLERSKAGRETLIELGERIATRS